MPSNFFKLGDWLYVLPLAAVGLFFGVIGFMSCGDCTAVTVGPGGGHATFAQAVARTLALIKASGSFPLDRNHWMLFLAQVIMPGLAFFGVFKLVLQNIRRDARVLWARRLRGHTIVCGLGSTGRQVVDSFSDAGRAVVVVALSADTPDAAACERRRIAVLEGDAGHAAVLKLAGLKHAHSVVVACGSDGTNLEIGMRVRDTLRGLTDRTVKILPELRSEWLYDQIKTQNAGVLDSTETEFQIFNLNINGARMLLGADVFQQPLPQIMPQPHLLFAGFGQMGAEVLVRAALCNFALPSQKLSAVILDARGPASIASAQVRAAGVENIADISFSPCQFAPDDLSWQAAALDEISKKPPLAVIVALRDDDVAINTAMRLRKMLDAQGVFGCPVFVRVRQQLKLGEFLSSLETQLLFRDRLQPFGGLSTLTNPAALLDESLDTLARAAHRVWLSENAGSDSPAVVPWEKLSEFHKQNNRTLADFIPIRLRSCGYRMAQGRATSAALDDAVIEKLAALEHWRWCRELVALGWRYADIRDDFLKRHNRLVEWDMLPDTVKDYNRAMARMLPQIADAAGMSLVREQLLFADELDNAQIDAAAQLVIIADPRNADAWHRARGLAQDRNGKLWALVPDGASPQLFRRLETTGPDLIERWLGESQGEALRQQRTAH
jgi:hypothetical protein